MPASEKQTKLTKSYVETLVKKISKVLIAKGVTGTNQLKNDLKGVLIIEKDDKMKVRYNHINGTMIKEVLKHIPKEHTEVVTKIMEVFRDLLNTKPTRLLSAYMNFSIEYGKRPDMAKLPMIERAPHIKEAWEKLSDAKKKTYEPSASQKKAYDDKNAIFNKKLKDFKS